MLGAKYGFVQSMDCTAQTVDPYFVWAIHALRVHDVCLNFVFSIFIYINFIFLF